MFCVAVALVSPINVSIESSTFLEEDSLENFCILIRALKSWCPKTYWRFCFELTRLSKSNFSVNRAVIFSIAVWIEKIRFWTDFKVEKMSNFLLATATWWRKMFQKVLRILMYLDIQTPLSRNFQVRFVTSRFQSFFVEWSQIIRLRSSRYFSCIRILIVPNFQKLILILTWLSLQTWYSA